MGNPANNGFDPKAFLTKVGADKTILKLEKYQHVFEQGDVADKRQRASVPQNTIIGGLNCRSPRA
jgi:hypothetical protein